MNKINLILIASLFVLSISSCNNNKLINSRPTRLSTEKRFEEVKELGAKRYQQLFGVLENKNISREERDALIFLFSSMPLSDLADYQGSFFLDNVRSSLKARRTFPWSPSIPEDIYLHFVLPIRVNNENLDSFRIKYYDELRNRVEGISDIESAALEINHWCHEKVSYQGADIRTSAPMATILSGRGRCGEESTFTVAALRTVGIPARQVYVPRWSHSDDNHAWVEVWTGEAWKYLGACEPEPVLNRGWFTGAASRAMLVHTKSFGKYTGNEKLIGDNKYYGEINNLALYADTKNLVVEVVDKEGRPQHNALVEYKVYNYAEFFTLAESYTDSKGVSEFETGRGDLLIWCSRNGKYGFSFVSVAVNDTVKIVIGDTIEDGAVFTFDHYIPSASRENPDLSEEKHKANRERLKEEDRIREEYISGWIDSAGVAAFALEYAYSISDLLPLINRSMGNYREIMNFLESVDKEKREEALKLLNVIADKDLRDTPASVLLDHLVNTKESELDYPEDIYVPYVLNPRIANEILTPWRKYLQRILGEDDTVPYIEEPSKLAEWVNARVDISDEWNYYKVPVSPRGSLELGISDKDSRDILFVALCRSIGVAARLEPGRGLAQYYKDGEWKNISYPGEKEPGEKNARLTMSVSGQISPVEYYTHFTIARIRDGRCITLDFGYGEEISDMEWPLQLAPGLYMLVTGNRLNNNEILSEIRFFTLDPNEDVVLDFSLREEKPETAVIQNIIPENTVFTNTGEVSVYSRGEAGTVLAWINHEKEPSKHFLNELRRYANQFNKWDGRIFLLSDSSYLTNSFTLLEDEKLPGNIVLGYESGYRLLKELFPDTDLLNPSFPVVVYINRANELIFKSEGYSLGLSNQILKYINLDKY